MPRRGTQRAHAEQPHAEGKDPADVVARNIKGYRHLRDGMTQAGLAERMTDLGFGWSEQVAGFAERGQRVIGVNELVALALALQVTPADLLDPTGPDRSRRDQLHVGAGIGVEPRRASLWMRDRLTIEIEWEGGEAARMRHRGRTDEDAQALLAISHAEAAERIDEQTHEQESE